MDVEDIYSINQLNKNKMADLKEISSEDLRQELELRGYYTQNLWHVDDVMKNYDCESEDAQELLDKVMTSEWITEQIFIAIDEVACGMFAPKIEDQ